MLSCVVEKAIHRELGCPRSCVGLGCLCCSGWLGTGVYQLFCFGGCTEGKSQRATAGTGHSRGQRDRA